MYKDNPQSNEKQQKADLNSSDGMFYFKSTFYCF